MQKSEGGYMNSHLCHYGILSLAQSLNLNCFCARSAVEWEMYDMYVNVEVSIGLLEAHPRNGLRIMFFPPTEYNNMKYNAYYIYIYIYVYVCMLLCVSLCVSLIVCVCVCFYVCFCWSVWAYMLAIVYL